MNTNRSHFFFSECWSNSSLLFLFNSKMCFGFDAFSKTRVRCYCIVGNTIFRVSIEISQFYPECSVSTWLHDKMKSNNELKPIRQSISIEQQQNRNMNRYRTKRCNTILAKRRYSCQCSGKLANRWYWKCNKVTFGICGDKFSRFHRWNNRRKKNPGWSTREMYCVPTYPLSWCL